MNVFCGTGNLGKDGEQRFTANGDSIVGFSLAIKTGYGEKAVTTWLNCSIFGKRGESLLKFLTKGTQIGITGEILLREYTTNDGVKKSSLECRVSDVTLLGKPQDVSVQPTKSKTNEQDAFDDGDSVPF